MRNGNQGTQKEHEGLSLQFLSYLWGMETANTLNTIHESNPFLSYLWGMETDNEIRRGIPPFFSVLILPMRNGNLHGLEWEYLQKKKFLSYLWGMETCFVKLFSIYTVLFLSYLWGMETLVKFQTAKIERQVLILPMRNGNIDSQIDLFHVYLVLILPMRNGNSLP